jgi:hypothetical protein
VRWRRVARPELSIPLLAVIMRVVAGPRVIDDAYIIFRYAQNLLGGNGFVFNPGEAVFGITTPLFAGLLAALGALSGGTAAPFPTLALGVNALADAGTCWLLILLGRRLDRPMAGILAALVWAIAPMSVTFAIGGMETSVFILLMTATLYFHSSRRPVAAAACAGLSLITRPDALIVILLLVLERIRQGLRARKDPGAYPDVRLPEIGALLAPPAVWAALAWSAYGSPIPQSIVAKAQAYHLPDEAAFVRLLQHFAAIPGTLLRTGQSPSDRQYVLRLWARGTRSADGPRRGPSSPTPRSTSSPSPPPTPSFSAGTSPLLCRCSSWPSSSGSSAWRRTYAGQPWPGPSARWRSP